MVFMSFWIQLTSIKYRRNSLIIAKMCTNYENKIVISIEIYRIWKNGNYAHGQNLKFYITKKQFKSAIDVSSETSSNN